MLDSAEKLATPGDRIAQARRVLAVKLFRDVSQLDVARAIGVSASTVSHWETNRKTPSRDSTEKLCRLLGVNPGYILFNQRPAEARVDLESARRQLDGIPEPVLELPDPTKDRKLTEAEVEEYVRQAEREERERAAAEGEPKRQGDRRRRR